MKLRNLLIAILSLSFFVFFLPAHADYWEDLRDKTEHSIKKEEKHEEKREARHAARDAAIAAAEEDDDTPPPPPPNNFGTNGYVSGNWVGFNGFVPRNAVPGGVVHGTPAFICQGDYQGEPHPGRITPMGCAVAFGGQEYISPIETILIGHHYYWQDFNPAAGIPPNAVLGGTEGGAPIFVCQAQLDDGIYPGKLVGDNNCYVAAHHVEVSKNYCKVLCSGDTPPPPQAYNGPALPGSYGDDDDDD
jgi:hypothetical protein